jgi:hypothetical protein
LAYLSFIGVNYTVTKFDTFIQAIVWNVLDYVQTNSIHCGTEPGTGQLGHVRSMMYAVDRIGLDVIKGIPYNCLDESIEFGDSIIHSYERKMGQTMLTSGHALASFLGPFL